jgi:hypothetical protein
VNHPGFVELRDLQMLIRARIFDLPRRAIIDDET